MKYRILIERNFSTKTERAKFFSLRLCALRSLKVLNPVNANQMAHFCAISRQAAGRKDLL